MTNQQQEMIEYTIQEVIGYLINGIPMEQAMEQFYISNTFDKLADVETGLYLDGSAYVYELLKRETKNNTIPPQKTTQTIKFPHCTPK